MLVLVTEVKKLDVFVTMVRRSHYYDWLMMYSMKGNGGAVIKALAYFLDNCKFKSQHHQDANIRFLSKFEKQCQKKFSKSWRCSLWWREAWPHHNVRNEQWNEICRGVVWRHNDIMMMSRSFVKHLVIPLIEVCILEWDVLCWYGVMCFRKVVTHWLSKQVVNHSHCWALDLGT